VAVQCFMNSPRLTCWGGVGAVTGANFLLETATKRSLIDCGLLQGTSQADDINAETFPYEPLSINFLFITHAHIDHIGKVPKLVKDGFKGVIYSTQETMSLALPMLRDMAKISEGNARTRGGEPLYTAAHVEETMRLWQSIPYHAPKDLGDFVVELFDAGHILGSSMYKFVFPSGKSMVFTGDLGNSPSPLLRDTEIIKGADYMLMDSVYGDRNHEDKHERDERLKEIIGRVIKDKGTLLIPVFSLERSQILLYQLDNLFESKQIPSVPVFLDSPLAIRLTAIYEQLDGQYNTAVQEELKKGDDVFRFPKLRFVTETRESRELVHVPGPKIIMAGSGMSTAGRILDHEKMFLPDPHTTLLLVGYQAPGTLGRLIEDKAPSITIKGETIHVKAHVEKIDGFSAHKDSNNLVEFVSHTKDTLKKVFVTMGEPKSSMFLAQRLHDELDVDAVVPERGKSYTLEL
jgi:metallo-beta-lactamase family protein